MFHSGSCCIVPGCDVNNMSKTYRLFRIPYDKKLAKTWLRNCHREDLKRKHINVLHTTQKVCEKHFEASMFLNINNRLLPDAIPTIFHFSKKPNRERVSRKKRKVNEEYNNVKKKPRIMESSEKINNEISQETSAEISETTAVPLHSSPTTGTNTSATSSSYTNTLDSRSRTNSITSTTVTNSTSASPTKTFSRIRPVCISKLLATSTTTTSSITETATVNKISTLESVSKTSSAANASDILLQLTSAINIIANNTPARNASTLLTTNNTTRSTFPSIVSTASTLLAVPKTNSIKSTTSTCAVTVPSTEHAAFSAENNRCTTSTLSTLEVECKSEDTVDSKPDPESFNYDLLAANFNLASTPVNQSNHCIVPGCTTYSIPNTYILFSIPEDEQLARTWLIICDREDLLDKHIDDLHRSIRVCGKHFENRMFLNDLQNSLMPHAIPTLFDFRQKEIKTEIKQEGNEYEEEIAIEKEINNSKGRSFILGRPADLSIKKSNEESVNKVTSSSYSSTETNSKISSVCTKQHSASKINNIAITTCASTGNTVISRSPENIYTGTSNAAVTLYSASTGNNIGSSTPASDIQTIYLIPASKNKAYTIKSPVCTTSAVTAATRFALTNNTSTPFSVCSTVVSKPTTKSILCSAPTTTNSALATNYITSSTLFKANQTAVSVPTTVTTTAHSALTTNNISSTPSHILVSAPTTTCSAAPKTTHSTLTINNIYSPTDVKASSTVVSAPTTKNIVCSTSSSATTPYSPFKTNNIKCSTPFTSSAIVVSGTTTNNAEDITPGSSVNTLVSAQRTNNIASGREQQLYIMSTNEGLTYTISTSPPNTLHPTSTANKISTSRTLTSATSLTTTSNLTPETIHHTAITTKTSSCPAPFSAATTAGSASAFATITFRQFQQMYLIPVPNKKTCTSSFSSVSLLKSAQTTNSVMPVIPVTSVINTSSSISLEDRQHVSTNPDIEYRPRELTLDDFDLLCDKYLRKRNLSNFVKHQARLAECNSQAHQYEERFNDFAHTIYTLYPKCFPFLREMFYLPPKRILRKGLRKNAALDKTKTSH